jgi:hypothetical protein
MTLAGNEDWDFAKFNKETKVEERFATIYGPDNTGSVYNLDNLEAFQIQVLRGTQQKGVDLFTADGVCFCCKKFILFFRWFYLFSLKFLFLFFREFLLMGMKIIKRWK